MDKITETHENFESRKRDHIAHSMAPENQSSLSSGLEKLELIHEALPDINFAEVEVSTYSLGRSIRTPFVVSSMTGGHEASQKLNLRLAKAAETMGWAMGVGSQRRELFDSSASQEWKEIRKLVPEIEIFGNIGAPQLIETSIEKIKNLVESMQASSMIVHLNPLQEVLQREGTPDFFGALKAIEKLVLELEVPVIVKETGCGFSEKTLKRLDQAGVEVVDLSGLGGTHWGRIEGKRSTEYYHLQKAAETFSDWGISLFDSLQNARTADVNCEIWASGGVRSGLDVAKCLAMGATRVAFAQPAMKAALISEEELLKWMHAIEFELKVALFCTGNQAIDEFLEKQNWRWK